MGTKDVEHQFEDDRRAIFVELITQHQRKLYSYIYSLVPNTADSDDLLQETNLVLWKKAKEYILGTNFMAWACQIAFLNVQKFLTTQGRSRVYFNENLLSQLAELHMDRADSQTIYSMLLISCLEKLSEESKRLLKLRYGGNHGMQEIAEQLKRPVASLYNSLSHIRFKIMKCINYALKNEGHDIMFLPEDMNAPIWRLANAMCEGTISDEELLELESLLESDPIARDFYVDFLIVNSEISWLISSRQHSSMDIGPRISADILENTSQT